MSTARSLRKDHYRWWTREGKCCGECVHMELLAGGSGIAADGKEKRLRAQHVCRVHATCDGEKSAVVAPWMQCDKFKKGAKA